MHLWPSMRIRDSFKHAYLEKLEWNIHRMNVKKKQQQNRSQSPTTSRDRLLDDTDRKQQGDDDGVVLDSKNRAGGALALCRELLMILSCCYCCFCCGVYHKLRKVHLYGLIVCWNVHNDEKEVLVWLNLNTEQCYKRLERRRRREGGKLVKKKTDTGNRICVWDDFNPWNFLVQRRQIEALSLYSF
ncbi:hypothetical protein RHGRI_027427 [Rhododendron griersonianum]|uniref:Uncharacterized protein n=1 Tax=Rhododendron griersonianum TaxID=479676 RepID=A0AAV6J0U8_9ERIC|nr:hypothetical protein RHGRI_027427 [Rhododendron griersonianum]